MWRLGTPFQAVFMVVLIAMVIDYQLDRSTAVRSAMNMYLIHILKDYQRSSGPVITSLSVVWATLAMRT